MEAETRIYQELYYTNLLYIRISQTIIGKIALIILCSVLKIFRKKHILQIEKSPPSMQKTPLMS